MNKVKLMKCKDWLDREFCKDSQPSVATIKRMVVDGKIRGRIVGSGTYIFESETFGVEHSVSKAVDNLIRMSV